MHTQYQLSVLVSQPRTLASQYQHQNATPRECRLLRRIPTYLASPSTPLVCPPTTEARRNPPLERGSRSCLEPPGTQPHTQRGTAGGTAGTRARSRPAVSNYPRRAPRLGSNRAPSLPKTPRPPPPPPPPPAAPPREGKASSVVAGGGPGPTVGLCPADPAAAAIHYAPLNPPCPRSRAHSRVHEGHAVQTGANAGGGVGGGGQREARRQETARRRVEAVGRCQVEDAARPLNIVPRA